MAQNLEIIASPFEVWLAPVGEAFPAIDDAPEGNWEKLGASGNKNIAEEGVTVTHEQAVEVDAFRMLGSTGPRSASRTSESLTVAFTLHDLTPEMYAKALNDQTVTDTASGTGTAGFRTLPLMRGTSVSEYALLVRGPSTLLADHNAQYEIPRCFQNGNPAPVFSKGEPAGLAFEFVALEDADASAGEEFGRFVVADAVAV